MNNELLNIRTIGEYIELLGVETLHPLVSVIDDSDHQTQETQLKRMLGSMGERVWIAKTFNCDNGKNIFIGNDFTGDFKLTIIEQVTEKYV